MEKSNLTYVTLSQKLSELLTKTDMLMAEAGNIDQREALHKELALLGERTDLKLAFVGQYSSGKSTIISALTGNKDIKIDANVSTDEVSSYEWHNVQLLDTPGILAGKCEHHDERAKEALKSSDLIVFVITSQLFDDVVFNNFIDIAYNQQYKDKMLLVVNKMGLDASDSFDDLVTNYRQSLTKIFSERELPLDIPMVFIDAVDYIEGVDEGDEDYVRMSNFDSFVKELDRMIEEKGVIKKQFDTPVRIVQSYLTNMAVTQIDPHLMSLMDQYTNKIRKFIRDVERGIEIQLMDFEQNCMSETQAVASGIGEQGEQEFKDSVGNLSGKVNEYAQSALTSVEENIERLYGELQSEIDVFAKDDSITVFIESINIKLSAPDISIDERVNLENQKKILNGFSNAGNWIGKMAPNVKFFGGPSQASGSALHQTVKNVGHFLGHKFQPWQATRWASNIGKFAKFGIPAATTVLSVGMELYAAKKEKERMRKIDEMKRNFIAVAKSEILNAKNTMRSQIEKCTITQYDKKLRELDNEKIALAESMDKNNKLMSDIKSLNEECSEFIDFADNAVVVKG